LKEEFMRTPKSLSKGQRNVRKLLEFEGALLATGEVCESSFLFSPSTRARIGFFVFFVFMATLAHTFTKMDTFFS